MAAKITPDPRSMPNGSVLVLGIRYIGGESPGGESRGRTNPTLYTYAALKAGGLWYLTGSGKVPTAAGWGAVERWLERDNRVLDSVWMMGLPHQIFPRPDPAAESIDGQTTGELGS